MSKKHIHNKPKAATPLVTSTIINDSIALKKIQISLGIIIAVFAFALYAQSISYDYTLRELFFLSLEYIISFCHVS